MAQGQNSEINIGRLYYANLPSNNGLSTKANSIQDSGLYLKLYTNLYHGWIIYIYIYIYIYSNCTTHHIFFFTHLYFFLLSPLSLFPSLSLSLFSMVSSPHLSCVLYFFFFSFSLLHGHLSSSLVFHTSFSLSFLFLFFSLLFHTFSSLLYLFLFLVFPFFLLPQYLFFLLSFLVQQFS